MLFLPTKNLDPVVNASASDRCASTLRVYEGLGTRLEAIATLQLLSCL